jgi:nucleoside-specific outer membrane channel protein Tsx
MNFTLQKIISCRANLHQFNQWLGQIQFAPYKDLANGIKYFIFIDINYYFQSLAAETGLDLIFVRIKRVYIFNSFLWCNSPNWA